MSKFKHYFDPLYQKVFHVVIFNQKKVDTSQIKLQRSNKMKIIYEQKKKTVPGKLQFKTNSNENSISTKSISLFTNFETKNINLLQKKQSSFQFPTFCSIHEIDKVKIHLKKNSYSKKKEFSSSCKWVKQSPPHHINIIILKKTVK